MWRFLSHPKSNLSLLSNTINNSGDLLAHYLQRERVHGKDGGVGRAVQRDGGVHREGLRRGGQQGTLRGGE